MNNPANTEAAAKPSPAPKAEKPAAAPKKEAVKKEAKPKVEKPPVDKQNDITKPRADSACGQVWAFADAAAKAAGGREKVARKDVIATATGAGINPATSATQFGRWRQYHGLVSHKAG
jgi:hypothetical protein